MPTEPTQPSMLVIAMRNIIRELPGLLDSFYAFTWDVLTTIVLPVGAVLVAATVTWKVLWEVWRILFPPSAQVFHREALGVLKKDDDAATIRRAERLLKKSIKRDSTFLPSHLSLASLQLYQKDSPDECMATIDAALVIFPQNKELKQLRMDATAVQQNMGHMVTAGAVTVPYLGEVPFRQRK